MGGSCFPGSLSSTLIELERYLYGFKEESTPLTSPGCNPDAETVYCLDNLVRQGNIRGLSAGVLALRTLRADLRRFTKINEETPGSRDFQHTFIVTVLASAL